MLGFFLIDKPEGPTSHDVVNTVRRVTGEHRVGHAGTLDPFASGLLAIGVGRSATREMSTLVGLDKEYEAEFILGARTDTDDLTGKITNSPQELSEKKIQDALKSFVGMIEQAPPAYSAVKINGKKLYESARKGIRIEAKPKKIQIYSISNVKFLNDNCGEHEHAPGLIHFSLTIHCSSGTYIRAIARDLGLMLGSGGYVQALRRTKIGPFTVNEAVKPESLTSQNVEQFLQPIQTFFARL